MLSIFTRPLPTVFTQIRLAPILGRRLKFRRPENKKTYPKCRLVKIVQNDNSPKTFLWHLLAANLPGFTQNHRYRWLWCSCPPRNCHLHSVGNAINAINAFNAIKSIYNAALVERSCPQAFREVILSLPHDPLQCRCFFRQCWVAPGLKVWWHLSRCHNFPFMGGTIMTAPPT